MPAGPLLDRHAVVRPGVAVGAVDAVQLHPAGVDQVGDRVDHAVVLEVPGPPLLGREHQHRTAVVAVGDQRSPGRARPCSRRMGAGHRGIDQLGQVRVAARRARPCSCARRAPSCSRGRVAEPRRASSAIALVVGQVLLGHARRSSRSATGRSSAAASCTDADELGHRRRSREKPDSCGSSSGVKKLPDCSSSPSNTSGCAAVRVQHRQRAEADPDADPHGRCRAASGSTRSTSVARVGRVGRVPRVALARVRAAPRAAAAAARPRCRRPRYWAKPPSCGELRAVVHDHQRRRSPVRPSGVQSGAGRPSRPARGASTSSGSCAAAPRAASSQAGATYPGNAITDLSPNAPGARSGLAGSVMVLPVAVVVLDLEQVLHPVDRRARQAQPPLGARRGRRSIVGQAEFLHQSHAGQAAVPVGEDERHAVLVDRPRCSPRPNLATGAPAVPAAARRLASDAMRYDPTSSPSRSRGARSVPEVAGRDRPRRRDRRRPVLRRGGRRRPGGRTRARSATR